jgi:hypothetical protein
MFHHSSVHAKAISGAHNSLCSWMVKEKAGGLVERFFFGK